MWNSNFFTLILCPKAYCYKPELTVSLLDLSTTLFNPPGVSDGLNDIERLPDTAAAAGTTSF